jgi:hypothetical protein
VFFDGSRYQKAGTFICTLPDGRTVTATRIPSPTLRPLIGYHRRDDAQRLDHLAYYYLKDPTTFWRLCDANDAPCPDALAAHRLVGIPLKDQ